MNESDRRRDIERGRGGWGDSRTREGKLEYKKYQQAKVDAFREACARPIPSAFPSPSRTTPPSPPRATTTTPSPTTTSIPEVATSTSTHPVAPPAAHRNGPSVVEIGVEWLFNNGLKVSQKLWPLRILAELGKRLQHADRRARAKVAIFVILMVAVVGASPNGMPAELAAIKTSLASLGAPYSILATAIIAGSIGWIFLPVLGVLFQLLSFLAGTAIVVAAIVAGLVVAYHVAGAFIGDRSSDLNRKTTAPDIHAPRRAPH